MRPYHIPSFNLIHAPLKGVNLIEAGAGTGKTYAIAGLYLRLVVEKGLNCNQILVVTFTKAATEELKTRIRHRLLAAKAFFSAGELDDELLQGMAKRIEDSRQALQRIQDALVSFDQAAIFTIHGFCQQLLQHFAFETGQLFQANLIQDIQPLLQETADDFWRRYITRAPAELARYALDRLKGPQGLAALLQSCHFPHLRILPDPIKPRLTAIRPWRQAARQVKELWLPSRSDIIMLLQTDALHANKYGKLAPHSDRVELSIRQVRVDALARAMDLWSGNYPLFDRFERFTQSYVTKATKKNKRVPEHSFFTACQRAMDHCEIMVQQMADYLRYLKAYLCYQADQRLSHKKSQRNILFFDDLLLRVHHALQSPAGKRLCRTVQSQFQAALVDEFQDTDPIQYDIFTRFFATSGPLFFMIGDPKQAIYGFRGADLFSYLAASDNAQFRYTLTRNWRSKPELIRAVNTIFTSRVHPFGFDRIKFEPAQAACPSDEDRDSTPALQLWYLTGNDSAGTDLHKPSRPMFKQIAIELIVTAVADAVSCLLNDTNANIVSENVAVLTRTHYQAQLIKQALSQRRVPAVLHSAGRVFDTHDAVELNRVLMAVAQPADPGHFRAAMATDILGASAHDLHHAMENPSPNWQARWAAFYDYNRLWVRHGFHRMFNRLMSQEGVKARILALRDGERRLTNLLHLAELIHQAVIEHRLGPEGVLKWLAAKRQEKFSGEETQQLRLESDARAVRIITIHKSKGLEFDVVFCPFIWEGIRPDSYGAFYHDSDDQDRLTLALGPDVALTQQNRALNELLAENLRLLYVALTRACKRCYLVWGRINSAESSALAYLLHGDGTLTAGENWVLPLQQKMTALTDAQFIDELQDLPQRSHGAITLDPLPRPGFIEYTGEQAQDIFLEQRHFKGAIDTSWRIASFSALTAEQIHESEDWPDRDALHFVRTDTDMDVGGFDDLFSFPRGVRAGLFLHDLLENYNFKDLDADKSNNLVAARLQTHGFDQRWASAIERLLSNLAVMTLPAEPSPFSLNQVNTEERINEMEFYFPLKPLHPTQLRRVFQRYGHAPMIQSFTLQLERLHFAPMQGFMKGYMDMVFGYNGQYFLVDWKSNHLGHHLEDYTAENLCRTMVQDYYFLQYHLYVTALDRLLQQRVPDYDYRHHFGGVYYLFLRGIAPDRGADTGVFYTIPEAGLIKDLQDILIAYP